MPSSVANSAIIDLVDTMPPEALLEDVSPSHRAIAQLLRDIVRRSAPEAIEGVRPRWRLIGYDLPKARHGTFFAWVWPEHEHVHLGFPQGWAMRDPGRLLNGRGETKRVRWLTFTTLDDVDERVCRDFLEEALLVAGMSRGERELRSEDFEPELA